MKEMDWKYFKWLPITVIAILIMTRLNSCEQKTASSSPFYKFDKYLPGSYEAKLYDIQYSRAHLLSVFEKEETLEGKYNMIDYAKMDFMELIEKELFPHWYGTKYDFHGTTQTPGSGKIACGYFVTTVLRDIGVPIQRVKMAQAASETMVKNLVDEDLIQRFRNVPIQQFVRRIEDMGEGLYVVGLDTHAGMLFYDGVELRFVHSTGRKAKQVVNEKALTSLSLIKSKYRVVGKISGDEDLIKSWLYNVAQE